MAKKKTAEKVKIESAPVLRALGGDEPLPEKPVVTKSYSVRDDWKDKGVVNTVAFKSVDGEVQDLLVNGEPAGGGSGGISTATVSITNNLSEALDIFVPSYFNDDDREFIIGQLITIPRNLSQNIAVAMGANGAIITVHNQFEDMECAGDVEPDGTDILITGDGSAIFS